LGHIQVVGVDNRVAERFANRNGRNRPRLLPLRIFDRDLLAEDVFNEGTCTFGRARKKRPDLSRIDQPRAVRSPETAA
jgi:hypothetical protein